MTSVDQRPDLLADVFPGTLDAPLPVWLRTRRPGDGVVPVLVPAHTDRRWAPQPWETR